MIFLHMRKHFISRQHCATMVTLNNILGILEIKLDEPLFDLSSGIGYSFRDYLNLFWRLGFLKYLSCLKVKGFST